MGLSHKKRSFASNYFIFFGIFVQVRFFCKRWSLILGWLFPVSIRKFANSAHGNQIGTQSRQKPERHSEENWKDVWLDIWKGRTRKKWDVLTRKMRRTDPKKFGRPSLKNGTDWIWKVGMTAPKNGKVWVEKWERLTWKSEKDWPEKLGRSDSKNETDWPQKMGRSDSKNKMDWLRKVGRTGP